MSDNTSDVTITVNRHATPTAPTQMLLATLRDQLGLTGARQGCEVGDCGACTVLVNGQPTRACVTSCGEIADAHVTTPEGLGTPDDPHPVQQAFLATQAGQCGYCINGAIMTVASLALQATNVDDDGLAKALDGNICRCGTHLRILQAARRALGIGDGAMSDDGLWCDRGATCVVDCRPESGAAPIAMPDMIAQDGTFETWLTVRDDGTIVLTSGRAEIGQGVWQSLRQVAAAQLGIDADQIVLATPSTDAAADEGFTAGSRSMTMAGPSVAYAAQALRRTILHRASERLGVDAATLTLTTDGGAVSNADGTAMIGLKELASYAPIIGRISSDDVPDFTQMPIGAPLVRDDLRRKLTGSAAFVHDMRSAGMRFARAVLPPTLDAELVSADTAPIEAMSGVEQVVRDGRLLLVIATSPAEASSAATALAARVRWNDPGLAFTGSAIETLRANGPERLVRQSDESVDSALSSGLNYTATYTVPYQSHGSLAPSAAVAELVDGHLSVWAHTQGIFPVKREIGALLGLPEASVTVNFGHGPGAYGHNGADDAAAFAAVAAHAMPDQRILFSFSMADEFLCETYGSAAESTLTAVLADDRIEGWRHAIVSDTAVARPRGDGDRVIAAWLRDKGPTRAWPGPHEGVSRNSVPIYDVGPVDAYADIAAGPVRTGSFRSLGAFPNIFAAESFLDELAERAGQDPLAFRLAHLSDTRARDVLEAAASRAGWTERVGPSGRGQGLALCQYNNASGYVAVVADVAIDIDEGALRVTRLTMAADVGTVINREGARQQIEGGAVQGVSRTLFERLDVSRRGLASRDFTSYPVLRFSDVPIVDLTLIDRPGSPPLGIGESSSPPVPAAIANAIDDAIGVRIRTLPITIDSVRDTLLTLDDEAAGRVRIEA